MSLACVERVALELVEERDLRPREIGMPEVDHEGDRARLPVVPDLMRERIVEHDALAFAPRQSFPADAQAAAVRERRCRDGSASACWSVPCAQPTCVCGERMEKYAALEMERTAACCSISDVGHRAQRAIRVIALAELVEHEHVPLAGPRDALPFLLEALGGDAGARISARTSGYAPPALSRPSNTACEG